MKPVIVLLVSMAWASTGAQYYQGLIDYLENRLLAIEDRMVLWHEQSHRYHTEMLNFKKLTAEMVDAVGKEHRYLWQDLGAAGDRVERAERELDYLERATSPRACVDPADKVHEQGVWRAGTSKRTREQVEEEEGEWEEVRSEVSDCVDIISSIRSVKILKRVGGAKGVWLRDPRTSKVYVFNGTAGDTVHRFDSLADLSRSPGVERNSSSGGGGDVRLPSAWSGAGTAVYDDYLYHVHRQGSDRRELQVVKYDLLKGVAAATALFPVADSAPVYALNPETAADLAADEHAVWLLFAAGEDEPNVHLAKMDPDTLDTEQMWDTGCPRANAEAAFVACGTVYVVYNTRPASRSRVQCVFDVNGVVVGEEAPLLYFPRRFGAHASLKYNADERQLYAWDDGYQILYRLNLKRKLLGGAGRG
ncbi:olfactomedin-like protein 3B [Gadus macrocephalus]|uniref:olfactomedin-like protein 3B n=1 Tax=Gadus macrocephalus TaxID=80720 RepID=UPI0028CB81B6|nr:olfactomedin-like protein 3B [Gadus macrocephalus]